MDAITTSALLAPTDPAALLRALTPEAIQIRLDVLEAEARGLRVLLRSLRARERAARQRREAQPCRD